MSTITIRLVYPTGRTSNITVRTYQSLLEQLRTHLAPGQVLLYDGGRVDINATIQSLNVSNNDSFDVMMPIPRVENSPMVRHLRREGLDPARFEYYGHVATAQLP